jgi:hypothetical protein
MSDSIRDSVWLPHKYEVGWITIARFNKISSFISYFKVHVFLSVCAYLCVFMNCLTVVYLDFQKEDKDI